MRKSFLSISLSFVFIIFILLQFNCGRTDNDKTMSRDEMVKRGNYLVEFGGCNDCHSPKVMTQMGPMPDTTRLLSGHPADSKMPPADTISSWIHTSMDLTAWIGPWGTSYTANLTPDEATGTGNWTEDVFIKAMRTGKHMGVGRDLLPPMPWFNLAPLKDEDLKSIFAYLKSLRPIKNKVPDPVPPKMAAAGMNKKGM